MDTERDQIEVLREQLKQKDREIARLKNKSAERDASMRAVLEKLANRLKRFAVGLSDLDKAARSVRVMPAPPDMPAWNEEMSKDGRSILDLNISVRLYNLALTYNIVTVGDLCNMRASELLNLHGLGRKVLGEIWEVLAEAGLTLRPEL